MEGRGDASVRLFSGSFAHVCRHFTPEYPLANSKSYLCSLLFKVRKGVKNLLVFFGLVRTNFFFVFNLCASVPDRANVVGGCDKGSDCMD